MTHEEEVRTARCIYCDKLISIHNNSMLSVCLPAGQIILRTLQLAREDRQREPIG